MHTFSFIIVNFPVLDGDVPFGSSYGVHVSQVIQFARICNSVSDLNDHNLVITRNPL
jgi:hypothetical protein